jgi:hypothetical protein
MPMPKATSIKPTHKALKKYYAALQSYRDDGVTHEAYRCISRENRYHST